MVCGGPCSSSTSKYPDAYTPTLTPLPRFLSRGDSAPLGEQLLTETRFIHRDEVSKDLPFILETPEMNTLLPGSAASAAGHANSGRFDVKYICEPATPSSQRLSISSPINTQYMESFQLSAKVSALLHRALRHEHYVRTRPGYLPPVNTFASLDAEIRNATQTLLEDDVTNWQVTLDCFAMTVS